MTDMCWMAAQLLADCLATSEAKTTPLLGSTFDVAGYGEATIAIEPTQDAIAPALIPMGPEFPTPADCELPAVRPKRLQRCETDQPTTPAAESLMVETYRGEIRQQGRSLPANTLPLFETPVSPSINRASNAYSRPSEPSGLLRQPSQGPSVTMPQTVAVPTAIRPEIRPPQFSRPSPSTLLPSPSARFSGPRPTSGSQLYQQRLAALQAGHMYTRVAPNSFQNQWQGATAQPTYGQWQSLLAREAEVMAASQGRNRLTVIVGDSLSLWLPTEFLPRDRFWLNQSISGETTAGMLQRLHYFDHTHPTTIQIMAGINDLKNGASDAQVVGNLRQMMVQLHRQHPQARIVVHSILPTRWGSLPSDRIRRINQQIAVVASQQGAEFVDLQDAFTDDQGVLNRAFTTDGLHLSSQGYRIWQFAMLRY